MKKIVMLFLAMLIIFGFISACNLNGTANSETKVIDLGSNPSKDYWEGYYSGSFWYYSYWVCNEIQDYVNSHPMAANPVDYQNLDYGRYTVDWNNPGISGFNFTCGKGWETGSPYRNVYFKKNSFNGGSNGTLALYGWTGKEDSDLVVEYYVVEGLGAYNPCTDPNEGFTPKGTLDSDFGTYDVYARFRQDEPWIFGGNGDFWQYYSIRRSFRDEGTITFKKHVDEWAAKGMPLSEFSQYQIFETEGWQSTGSSDIVVGSKEAIFQDMEGKYAYGGLWNLGLGEKRLPQSGSVEDLLDGIYSKVYFDEADGDEMNIRISLVPVDSGTAQSIRDIKYPSDSELTGSNKAADRYNHRLYNASDLVVEDAFEGWVDVTDEGKTIEIDNIYSGGIELDNFIMTISKSVEDPVAPPSGTPYIVIDYTYSYSDGSTTYNVDGNWWFSRKPHWIDPEIRTNENEFSLGPVGSNISASVSEPSKSVSWAYSPEVQPGAEPVAIEEYDSYSFASNWSGKHVTVTDTGNNAVVKAQPKNEGWTSQDWIAEPVSGEENIVRIKNIWTGKYLHAQSSDENAKAVCYDLHSDWWSQQWIVEQVGFRKIRLRNRWSNRFLTVVDTGDYADILLKDLNTDWTSQVWDVDPLIYH